MIINTETESLLYLSVANLPPLNEVDRIMIIIFLVFCLTSVYILHLFIKVTFCPPRPKIENLKDSNVTSSILKFFSPVFYYSFSYNKKQTNVS